MWFAPIHQRTFLGPRLPAEKLERFKPDPGTSVCLTHNIVPGSGHPLGAGGLYSGLSAVSNSRFWDARLASR